MVITSVTFASTPADGVVKIALPSRPGGGAVFVVVFTLLNPASRSFALAWARRAGASSLVAPIRSGTWTICGRPARYRPAPSAMTARMPRIDSATRTQVEVRRPDGAPTRDIVPVGRLPATRGGGGGSGGA